MLLLFLFVFFWGGVNLCVNEIKINEPLHIKLLSLSFSPPPYLCLCVCLCVCACVCARAPARVLTLVISRIYGLLSGEMSHQHRYELDSNSQPGLLV